MIFLQETHVLSLFDFIQFCITYLGSISHARLIYGCIKLRVCRTDFIKKEP